MNKFMTGLGTAAIYAIGAVISLVLSTTVFMGIASLDTSKIDGNIQDLKSFPWFNRLY